MKTFSEVFPNLKYDSSTSFLLPYLSVRSMRYGKGKESLQIQVEATRLIPGNVFRGLEKDIESVYLKDSGMEAHILEEFVLPEDTSLSYIVQEYKDTLLEELGKESPLYARFLKSAEFLPEDPDVLTIRIEDHILTRNAEKHFREQLLRIFHERFLVSLRLHFDYIEKDRSYLNREETVKKDIPVFPEPDTEAEPKETIKETPKKAKNSPKKAGTLNKGSENRPGKNLSSRPAFKADAEKDPEVIYGRRFTDEVKPIASYGIEEGEVVIEGQIFFFDTRIQKNGERTIISFALSDGTDSVSVKLFVNNDDVKRLSDDLKPGKAVKVRGLLQYDTYDRETTVRSVSGILKSSRSFKNMREDNAPVKRVELHCHTKASSLDGIADVNELIDTAHAFGHSAMAITDHGCVYAFPDAFHALKKDDPLKLIYGMEGYLVDDEKEYVGFTADAPLNRPAVVFDLETTGFSPQNCAIIEIGAVRVEDGKIVDRFSTFVNPGVPIPYRIEMLTHISDSMVQDAPSIDVVLPDFLKFIDGAYLVAHNASFDISFLTQNIKKLGLPEEPFDFVDTVGVSRRLIPHLGNYRLETLAKELKVVLDSHHRACDDAECTAGIWLKLMERLEQREITTFSSPMFSLAMP